LTGENYLEEFVMAVLDAIKKRYSCRSYLDKPIEQNKLDEILEAARLAPSAKNLQDWRFVIVTDKAKKRQLAEAANNQKFLENVGAIIVACSVSSHIMRCGQPIGPIDIAIALEHISLQAAQSGLATCWIGLFYPEKVRPILGIPEDVAVIELMALGYPADKPPVPNRQPLDKIACYEKWQF
jgi:nitroreductase